MSNRRFPKGGAWLALDLIVITIITILVVLVVSGDRSNNGGEASLQRYNSLMDQRAAISEYTSFLLYDWWSEENPDANNFCQYGYPLLVISYNNYNDILSEMESITPAPRISKEDDLFPDLLKGLESQVTKVLMEMQNIQRLCGIPTS